MIETLDRLIADVPESSNIFEHRRRIRAELVCAGVRGVHQPVGVGGGGGRVEVIKPHGNLI